GDLLRRVAHHGPVPQFDTLPLTRGVVTGRAVLDRRTIQVADLHAETDEYPEGSRHGLRHGHRTILAVPLIRTGEAIGVIASRPPGVPPSTIRRIDLPKTSPNQAVVAMENRRLFEEEQTRTGELQARTRELKESLEQQTATADVLKVISRSALDVQKVLDA